MKEKKDAFKSDAQRVNPSNHVKKKKREKWSEISFFSHRTFAKNIRGSGFFNIYKSSRVAFN